MNDDMTRLLLERAAQQRGLVTRSDLNDIHVTRHQRARLVRIGSLVPVGRRTFELGGLPADGRRRLLAACLDAGGVASHRSAAWLHGLTGFQLGLAPEVMVERLGSEYRVPCAQVHTTTWLPSDDLVVVDGLPATSVARTLLSLASLVPQIPLDQVRGAVDEAVRDRKASDAWLWWRLERLRRRGRPGLTVLGSILAARAGGEVTESWLEREFLRILAGAGGRAAGLPASPRTGGSLRRSGRLHLSRHADPDRGHRGSRSQRPRATSCGCPPSQPSQCSAALPAGVHLRAGRGRTRGRGGGGRPRSGRGRRPSAPQPVRLTGPLAPLHRSARSAVTTGWRSCWNGAAEGGRFLAGTSSPGPASVLAGMVPLRNDAPARQKGWTFHRGLRTPERLWSGDFQIRWD